MCKSSVDLVFISAKKKTIFIPQNDIFRKWILVKKGNLALKNLWNFTMNLCTKNNSQYLLLWINIRRTGSLGNAENILLGLEFCQSLKSFKISVLYSANRIIRLILQFRVLSIMSKGTVILFLLVSHLFSNVLRELRLFLAFSPKLEYKVNLNLICE